jgi:hypothetical protein
MSLKLFFLSLFSFAILVGCQTSKGLNAAEENIRPKPAMAVLKQNEKSWTDYKQLGMKIEGFTKSNEDNIEFKANVRIKKDSAIWMSISPALGIEIARVLVLKDSLKVLSKIPDNKFAYVSDIDSLQEFLHFEFDLEDLESIMSGRPVGIDRIGGKFKSDVDDNQYLIATRYKRRIKKSMAILNQNPDTLETEDERIKNREKRRQHRLEEDGLILSKYWFDNQHFHLNRCVFQDLMNNRFIEIKYNSWSFDENEEKQNAYPGNVEIIVTDKEKQFVFGWNVNKWVTDRTFEYPFEIPEGYELKKKL